MIGKHNNSDRNEPALYTCHTVITGKNHRQDFSDLNHSG
jgi:hypothetical protein